MIPRRPATAWRCVVQELPDNCIIFPSRPQGTTPKWAHEHFKRMQDHYDRMQTPESEGAMLDALWSLLVIAYYESYPAFCRKEYARIACQLKRERAA